MRNYCKILLLAVWGGAVLAARAAEIKFDFGQCRDGQLPPGFISLVSGSGHPGEWKTTDEIVAPVMVHMITNAPEAMAATAKHPVLTLSSAETDPGHSPLLLFTNETFDSFTLTTKFKIVSGSTAPEAGIAFRVQNASNYYVIRASTQGNLLWYRVVNGVRYMGNGIGVQIPIAADTWQELRVECAGNSIRGFLNGRLLIPPVREGAPTNNVAINDNTFAVGAIGFWTAGDTVACFGDTLISYNRRVPLIQSVVLGVMHKYDRLLGLKVYALRNTPLPVVIADGKNESLGASGGQPEMEVIKDGKVLFLRQPKYVEVTQPLRDRNGEVIAAIQTRLTTFKGETTENAVARATAIKKAVEANLSVLEDINN